MDAMPEHSFRRQQSALLINMSVIARAHTHIKVHHCLAQDNAQSALLGGFEPDFATVFENRRIDHRGGGAVAGKFVEKLRRLGPRLWSGELTFDGKNVLAQPWKQFALASGDGGI